MNGYMSGEIWVIEYYKHPAPLALRSEDADSHDLLFAQPSINCPNVASSDSVYSPLSYRAHGLRRSNTHESARSRCGYRSLIVPYSRTSVLMPNQPAKPVWRIVRVNYPPLSCMATIVGACRVTDEPG
jgi:hypothetical protein